MLEFLVTGSKGNLYELKFNKVGDYLYSSCSCPAGRFKGDYCKHRDALLAGNISALKSDNPQDIKALKKLLAGTEVEAEFLLRKKEPQRKQKKIRRAYYANPQQEKIDNLSADRRTFKIGIVCFIIFVMALLAYSFIKFLNR